MTRRLLTITTWTICGLLVCSGNALAQEQKKATGGPEGAPAEMDEQMKQWIEMSQPGPNHKQMEYCVGTWKVSLRHWMAPDAPPQESSGMSTSKLIFGGRFVETHYKGEFMGMPFEGTGVMGYDNLTQQYVSTWIDAMTTGITYETGTYDADKREFTFSHVMDMPEMGKIKSKTVTKILSPDRHLMTFFHTEPNGTEFFKVMEITYERAAESTAAPAATDEAVAKAAP